MKQIILVIAILIAYAFPMDRPNAAVPALEPTPAACDGKPVAGSAGVEV